MIVFEIQCGDFTPTTAHTIAHAIYIGFISQCSLSTGFYFLIVTTVLWS